MAISPNLQQAHFDEWVVKSGISEEITKANLESVSDANQIKEILNREKRWNGGGGWCALGVEPLTGEKRKHGQFKPDKPQKDKKGRIMKYLTPSDLADGTKLSDPVFLAMPNNPNYWADLAKTNDRIVITEGAKKAAALLSIGIPAIGLSGVWMAHKSDSNPKVIRDCLKPFFTNNREIVVCFDADFAKKEGVWSAIEELTKMVTANGCKPLVAAWAAARAKGIDDLLVEEGKDAVLRVFANILSAKEWADKYPKPKPEDRPLIAVYHDAILEKYGEKLRFNELTKAIELDGKPIKANQFRLKVANELDFELSMDRYNVIVPSIANDNAFHPVKDYLSKCPNQEGILENLASRAFGTKNQLHNTFLKKWLISAVARIFNAGCKVDHVLVLHGDQGLGKSSFLQTLASPDWFSDDCSKALANKDNLLRLHQKWIIELGEIDRVTKSRHESDLKNFLSTQSDTFRVPYGVETENFPRQFIFAGTTNKKDWLCDATGNRRFWVVTAKMIDLEYIRLNRDLIWGEAVRLYLAGESYWLTKEEQDQSNHNNQSYHDESPYMSLIETYCDGLERVSVTELLHRIAPSDLKAHTRSMQREVVNCLTLLGYEKNGERHKAVLPNNSDMVRVYSWVKINRSPDNQGITNIENLDSYRFDDIQQNLITSNNQSDNQPYNSFTVSNSEDSGYQNQKNEQNFKSDYCGIDSVHGNSKSFDKKLLTNNHNCGETLSDKGSQVWLSVGSDLVIKPSDNQSVTLDDDEWIDIPDPAPKPTAKKSLNIGDKVRYVGKKFEAIYGNKELIISSSDGYEIDCKLPDGSYTTKFKVRDRELELVD